MARQTSLPCLLWSKDHFHTHRHTLTQTTCQLVYLSLTKSLNIKVCVCENVYVQHKIKGSCILSQGAGRSVYVWQYVCVCASVGQASVNLYVYTQFRLFTELFYLAVTWLRKMSAVVRIELVMEGEDVLKQEDTGTWQL